MGLVLECAENLIRRIMEDPEEMDRKNREHIDAVKVREDQRDVGAAHQALRFWTFDCHNAQLARDAQISNATGRRDPYDDLLLDDPM